MQKENVRLTEKLELFTNVRVLRAGVELDDEKSHIVGANAYGYNRDKRGGNRGGRGDRAERGGRRRDGDGRGYGSAYEEKQKCYWCQARD